MLNALKNLIGRKPEARAELPDGTLLARPTGEERFDQGLIAIARQLSGTAPDDARAAAPVALASLLDAALEEAEVPRAEDADEADRALAAFLACCMGAPIAAAAGRSGVEIDTNALMIEALREHWAELSSDDRKRAWRRGLEAFKTARKGDVAQAAEGVGTLAVSLVLTGDANHLAAIGALARDIRGAVSF